MWTPEKQSRRRYTSRADAMRESVKGFIRKFFDDFGGVEVPEADADEMASTMLGYMRGFGRYLLGEEQREQTKPPARGDHLRGRDSGETPEEQDPRY